MKTNCTFAEVIEALKQGKRVARPGWNGVFFAFRQVPSEVPAAVVPKMTSLPASVKEFFEEKGRHLTYSDQLAGARSDGRITSWCPSVPDIFAEDWRILDDEGTAPLPGFAEAGETVGTAKPLTGVL